MDWPGLMQAGMVGLRLTPDRFWRLTPAELALMLGIGAGAAPLTRARLDELSRQWPDAVRPLPDTAAGQEKSKEKGNGGFGRD